jgi:hypothetical protein
VNIFSDNGKAIKPSLTLLKEEIEACPQVYYKDNITIWNHSFRVKQESENTLTIKYDFRNEEGLRGQGVRSVNQVGRNLISADYMVYDFLGKDIKAITNQNEKDLASIWLVIATKILASTSNDS